MDRYFTVDEANALLPEARRRIEGVADLVGRLQQVARELDRPDGGAGIPEAKALEARIDEELAWFRREGVQVKGVAPALLDFPARRHGETVLLCWLEGEQAITHEHPLESGFVGRRPI